MVYPALAPTPVLVVAAVVSPSFSITTQWESATGSVAVVAWSAA